MKDEIVSLNTVVTNFYQPLLKQFFLPSIKQSPIPVNIYDSGIDGDGFGEDQFKQNIQFKLEKIIESLSDKTANKFVIWSDVDIVFCKPIPQIIDNLLTHTHNKDICASPENKERDYLNSGFLVIRCNKRNIKFFNQLLKRVIKKNTTEQPEMNRLVKHKFANINLFILPCEYWNITVGINAIDPFFIHVNYIPGHPGKTYVNGKINAIKYFRKKFNAYIKLK